MRGRGVSIDCVGARTGCGISRGGRGLTNTCPLNRVKTNRTVASDTGHFSEASAGKLDEPLGMDRSASG